MGETKSNKGDKPTSDVDEHIAKRYELKRRLGKGAYGIVWKAIDNHTKEVVAVKKIFEAFRNQTDAQRTFREIMFLQAFKNHPNIITLRGLHKATNNKDIYLVFDFMDTDLHHVIKRNTVLKDVHKQFIMYQLFRATQYLHSGNVIHRDQKPSNVLINAECRIKIADFGLARSLAHANDEDDDGILTDYVATRWYRAPEILVASKKYTKGVDMWSLGCILGEMLLGKPLFPGSSTVNQMERIMAVLPEPTSQEIYNMCSGYGKGLLEGYQGPKTTLRELVRNSSEDGVDLLNRLLVFDPAKRLTAAEALKHPYVFQYCKGRELTLDRDITPPLDDDIQLSVSDYRNKLYEMMATARLKKKSSKQEIGETSGSSERLSQNRNGALSGKPSDYLQKLTHQDSKYGKDEGSLKRRNNISSEDKERKESRILRDRAVREREREKEREREREKEREREREREREKEREREREREREARIRERKEKEQWTEKSNKINNTHLDAHRVGSQRRTSSPKRGTQSRAGVWPDKSRTLASQKHSFKMNRHEENMGGAGDVPSSMHSSSYMYQPAPFRAALAQVKEKLRQAQSLNSHLASLPKVSYRRSDVGRPISSSPSHVNKYSTRHGILTSTEIQEIRAVLNK